MTDWEKRARELFHSEWAAETAIQLGREMTDARADEIARALLFDSELIARGMEGRAHDIALGWRENKTEGHPK